MSPVYNNIQIWISVSSGSYPSMHLQHPVPRVCVQNPLPIDQIEVQRRRDVLKRALLERRRRAQECTNWTPEPVYGREHRRVQTELYLEELEDHVEEAEVECQTDLFLDRPPTPYFTPQKTGWDKETQVYEGDVSYTVKRNRFNSQLFLIWFTVIHRVAGGSNKWNCVTINVTYI